MDLWTVVRQPSLAGCTIGLTEEGGHSEYLDEALRQKVGASWAWESSGDRHGRTHRGLPVGFPGLLTVPRALSTKEVKFQDT